MYLYLNAPAEYLIITKFITSKSKANPNLMDNKFISASFNPLEIHINIFEFIDTNTPYNIDLQVGQLLLS